MIKYPRLYLFSFSFLCGSLCTGRYAARTRQQQCLRHADGERQEFLDHTRLDDPWPTPSDDPTADPTSPESHDDHSALHSADPPANRYEGASGTKKTKYDISVFASSSTEPAFPLVYAAQKKT